MTASPFFSSACPNDSSAGLKSGAASDDFFEHHNRVLGPPLVEIDSPQVIAGHHELGVYLKLALELARRLYVSRLS